MAPRKKTTNDNLDFTDATQNNEEHLLDLMEVL